MNQKRHGWEGFEGDEVATGDGDATTGAGAGGGGGSIGEMLLLRIDGGVHGGVHWSREREVPRSVDLRAVRGGSEGRDTEVAEKH